MPDRIRITDVSPRDGLQNEVGVIATADKVRLVQLLCAAGVDEVEVSSFVSPKWVPQLGDAAEVFGGLAVLGLVREPPPRGRGQGVGGVELPNCQWLPDRFQPPVRSGETLRKAHALRKAMTGPEKTLWEALRRRELMDTKFRRQHPFGPYILDFFCQDHLLAVEIDGRTHADELAQKHDARRDEYIRSFGVEVMRVSNDAVLASVDAVVQKIRGVLAHRPALGTRKPTPQPPPSGRGLPEVPLQFARPVFSALVPNEKGMAAALDVRARTGLLDKVSVFTAASETFSRKNTNASIAETLERFKPVLAMARDAGLPVRGYVSCVIACPFEGPIAPGEVARVCAQLAELGVDELDLGDTIGAGDAASTRTMLAAVREALAGLSSPGGTSTQQSWWTRERLTLHLHDTFGRAADCVRAALDEGVRSFDSSVAGLGGCPYASTPGKRAPGNIATHKLVNTVRSAGYVCEVDDAALNRAAAFASEVVAKSRQPGQAEQMGQAIASSQPTQPDQSLGGSR